MTEYCSRCNTEVAISHIRIRMYDARKNKVEENITVRCHHCGAIWNEQEKRDEQYS